MLDVGTRLGPYEILALLGRGGMGEVYRAKDVRLGRDVAIKVLPERLAQDPVRLVRFEQEARTVAALAHPNIVVLYDVGEEQQVRFVVTELLEGTDLRTRIRSGVVAWREAFEIGVAVAEGLAAGHAKGIVHRDIKPENVFLTADGRVKILDFGIARREAPFSAEIETEAFVPHPTETGVALGTLDYMSPEQLRGQVVDHRSDQFSLGCVLYELVAGKKPFRGKTPADTIAAILHDEPPRLSKLGIDISSDAEHTICRCLGKELSQRFVSARDLATALRAVLSGSEISSAPLPMSRARSKLPSRRGKTRSLAILPLVNLNVNPDTEYLSDGITETIINFLSQLSELRVMARSTVFRYKDRDVDAQVVGRELKVQAVLMGQLLRRGNRLIIKVELVDARDGSQLWGEQFDRELSQVFAVEQAIARAIAEKLGLRLTGEQQRRLGEAFTHSAEAYQCYLKGRYHWNKRTEEGLRKGIKLFEQAIDIDPTYALAYTGLSDAYHDLGGWGYLPTREAYRCAKAAALRALAIDDMLAEAHVSLAMVLKEHDWDWLNAGLEYERGLALNPNYAAGYQWYGEYLAAVGRHEEAIAAFQRAIELDPLSLIINSTLGRHGYYFARQYDQAIAQLQKALDMDDKFWVAHLWLGWTYANIGHLPEALVELQTARRLDNNLEIVATLGFTYGRASQPREAQHLLDEVGQLRQQRYVSPMIDALITLGMGQHDQALGWLEKAYEDRAQMLSELRAEPAFDPLRKEPRFVELLRRVGLESVGSTNSG